MGWLRRRFVGIATAFVLLTIAASSYVVREVDEFARSQAERQLLETTRALSLVVDGEISRHEAVLKALASSSYLARGDFARFDAQARAQLAGPDAWIILGDRAGRQLVNTRLPAGAALPSGPPPNHIFPVLDRGQTHVCNLTEGFVEPRILCVDVPVMRDGRAAYYLSVIFKPQLLQRVIDAQRVPDSRFATILDRSGIVAWRNVSADRFVGQRATADMLDALARRREGVKESVSLEGVPTVIAYSRSRSGFSFLVAVPQAQLRASTGMAVRSGLAAAGAILALAVALALFAGGRLSLAIATLSSAAARLGRGEAVAFKPTGIPEVDEAGAALERAVAERDASDERFALAEEVGGVGAWDWDVPGDVGTVTSGYRRLHGLDDDDGPLQLRRIVDVIHPDDREGYLARLAAGASTTEPATNEYRVVHPDGSIRWVWVKGRLIRDVDGRPLRAVGIVRDVTAEREVERALAESEERLRLATEGTGVGIYDLDLSAGRGTWSARAFDVLGYNPPADGIGRYEMWRAAIHPDDLARVEREHQMHAAAASTWEAEYRIVRQDNGETRWLHTFGRFVRQANGAMRSIGVVTDITQRKAMEERLVELTEQLEQKVEERTAALQRTQEALIQSQKVEAMGKVTGGVAHDINNLLTPILGGLDLLQRRALPDTRARQLVSGALDAAERARLLVQRLLAFARRQPLQTGAVDVRALVTGMRELISSTLGPQIKVTVNAATDLPPAHADQAQLEMALLNLAVNARDAMTDGGTLAITVDRADAAGGPESLAAGSYVRLSVTDTGVGMSPEVMQRAIEPFFSTKGIGRGTGLGLSMVHGLMAQLGGAMTVNSTVGVGTTIELWLPEANVPTVEASSALAAVQAAGATGTALLVDDEALVRTSVAHMLADLGYAVVEAESAAQALALLDGGLVADALVTDHLMPGMTGTELARTVRSRRPTMRVVIISGYADVEDIAPDLPRLPKPFRQEELARLLAAETPEALASADGPA